MAVGGLRTPALYLNSPRFLTEHRPALLDRALSTLGILLLVKAIARLVGLASSRR